MKGDITHFPSVRVALHYLDDEGLEQIANMTEDTPISTLADLTRRGRRKLENEGKRCHTTISRL